MILVPLYASINLRFGDQKVSIKKFVRLNFFVKLKRIQANKFFNRHPFLPQPKIKVGIQNYQNNVDVTSKTASFKMQLHPLHCLTLCPIFYQTPFTKNSQKINVGLPTNIFYIILTSKTFLYRIQSTSLEAEPQNQQRPFLRSNFITT